MNLFLYSLLLYLFSPLIGLYLLLRAIKAKAYRQGFLQRLGFVPQTLQQSQKRGLLLHCASVGEVRAAIPLIKKLQRHYSHLALTISTTTPTGKQVVENIDEPNIDKPISHCYFPIDWQGSVKRFICRLRPQAVIIMETEIWPNFLNSCKKQQIPVLLANARLSQQSLNKYLKMEKFSCRIFQNLTHIAAQYESDKENFMRLGVDARKITLVGNIKFELSINQIIKQQQEQLKHSWIGERKVWIAASIHPGEFADVIQTQRQLKKIWRDIILIAVPRHPEKFSEFGSFCDKQNITYTAFSQVKKFDKDIDLLLVDAMGKMPLFFGIVNIAFIGGSLIERGGHNPLEAVANGVPCIMGKHYYNFSDVCSKLIDAEVLHIIQSQAELFEILKKYFKNISQLEQLSKRCLTVMQENQGAAEKTLQLIDKFLIGNRITLQ